MKKVTTAFVLGAGLGTRLRPYTEHMPKPMLPVRERPMITYAFDQLIDAGIEHLIVNTHHCPEEYSKAFPQASYRDVPITFCFEPELLETGGGLKNIENLIDPTSPLIIYNGDIYSDLPLQPLLDFHHSHDTEVTLALRTCEEPRNVYLSESGSILDFRHTLKPNQPGNTLYTGISIVEPVHLNRLTAEKKESLIPIWIEMIRQQTPPCGIVINDGNWNDIGTVAIYEKINSTHT